MGAILYEVVRPDMVGPFRAQTDAGTVAWPDPAALRLPGRDLQPLLTPDPLHPLSLTTQPDVLRRSAAIFR